MHAYGCSRWSRWAVPAAVLVTLTTTGCDALFPKKDEEVKFAKKVTPQEAPADAKSPDAKSPDAKAPATAPATNTKAPPTTPPTTAPATPAVMPKVAQETRFKMVADDATPPRPGMSWAFGASSPSPAWSFDGKHIAYHDSNCVTIRAPDGAMVKSLRLSAGAGGGESNSCSAPSWSHDNSKIAVGHAFHGPASVFDVASGARKSELKVGDSGLWSVQFAPDDSGVLGRVHQSGVAMIRTKGSGDRVVIVTDKLREMKGYFPSISPDGKRFARVVDAQEGALELASFDPATAAKAKIADPWEDAVKHDALVATRTAYVGGVIPEYTWSPDSERVAAVRTSKWYGGYDDYDYGFGKLVYINAESGQETEHSLEIRNPAWSPDGTWIAVESSKGPGIWLIDANAAQPTMQPLYRQGVEARWSPDGSKLLVVDPATEEGVVLSLSS